MMNDLSKNKQTLTEEMESLKRRIRELEQAEARWKQVEEALNKSEETFRNLIENAPDAIYVHANARFLYLNPMAATLFGTVSADQLVGAPLMDRFHPSCHAMIRERLHLLYEGNRKLPIVEQIYIRLDGSPVPVEAHAVPITYNHQKASLTFARDISQQKRAEELLRESEKQYRELTDFLPISFFEVDAAGSIISFNRTALEVFRYNEEDYKKGMNALQFFAPEEWQRVGESMGKVIQGTSTPGQEFTFLRKDGSKFIGLIYASPNIHQNKTVGIRGAMIDITDRKQAEEALRENEGRFRGLVEQAAVGVAEIDMNTGRFFTVNRRLCEMVGRTEEEILATTFQAITHPEDIQLHVEKTRMMLAGEIRHYSLEKRYLRKDGEAVWVNITVSPLWKPGEAPGRNIAVVEDITDRKRMEEEIREMSLRDQMTELYNRRGFITLAEQQIRAANRAKRSMLLTFIDCDGLKRINDTLGHEEGDRALIDTADVLRQTFRESDIIARLGGDEFAVLSIDAADMDPEDFSKRLQENIDAGNAKENRPYRLAMSWGTAVYDPGSPLSLDELMSSADERMYAQKKAKLNRGI